MKPAIFTLVALLPVPVAAAQESEKTPLACQGDAKVGFNWENERWSSRRYVEAKFILIRDGATLTWDSVSKILNASPVNNSCMAGYSIVGRFIQCTDESGGFLRFNTETMKGGVAQLYGATMDGAERDSVTVEAFTCQPF